MTDINLHDVEVPPSESTEIDLGDPLELDGYGPRDESEGESNSRQGGDLAETIPNNRQGGGLEKPDSNNRQGGGLVVNVIWDVENEALLNLAKVLEVDTSEAPSAMIRQAAINLSQSATYIVKAGLELTIAKETCGHGDFGAICTDLGISQQRASESMRYAKYASQIPHDQLDRYLALPKKSALLLGSADPEVIEFLLEDDHLDKTRRIRTTTQLKEIVAELNETEDALEKTEKENVALHEEIAGLKADAQRREAGSEYPMDVVMLRKESAALADEALADLSSIATYEERLMAFLGTCDPKDFKRYQDVAVYPALSNVASIARNALKLLQEMADRHKIDVSEIASFTTEFNPEELELLEADRQAMLKRKAERQVERAAVYAEQGLVKRKRGRQQSPA